MAEVIRDDPRQVLALLNSLGFVGITAPQLKAFMKDLKMHRKIKEREKQKWKDETKKKILSKQEQMLKDMMRCTLVSEELESTNNSESSQSVACKDSSQRFRVRCIPEQESSDIENEPPQQTQKTRKSGRQRATERMCSKMATGETEVFSLTRRRERSKSYETARRTVILSDSSQNIAGDGRKKSPVKDCRTIEEPRPQSAPEFMTGMKVVKERTKSVASDPTGLAKSRSPSRCSSRSHTKSFIRPWRLQPEAQRAGLSKKSDPVALYQKYKEEWKHISFPGEEQHAKVRWAIREKMLGTDPNPRPILKNSQSLQSIRKR